jgi:choline dehydrogenase
MHSGIGPAAELAKHSIPVVVDLPGVGTHLQDHPHVSTRYRAGPSCESISFLVGRTLLEKAKLLKAHLQYQLFGTGPLTCNVSP